MVAVPSPAYAFSVFEKNIMRKLMLIVFVSLISPAFAQDTNPLQKWMSDQAQEEKKKLESSPVAVVLEDAQIQKIKNDDSYINLRGTSKNEILYLDGEQTDAEYYKVGGGYILKSKCMLFSSRSEAEAYLQKVQNSEKQKAEQEAKKSAEAARKKADERKAEQAERQKACISSGAIVIINNWTWGRSYGDNVSIEGLVTNVSNSKLEYVKVVALFFDQNNTFISSAWGYTKITTIMPYQSSPFKFSWLGANPLAKYAQIKILDRQENEIQACSLK